MHRRRNHSQRIALPVGLVGALMGAAAATAQTGQVIPAAYATVDGDSVSAEPFAFDRVRHVQYVSGSLVNVTRGRIIRAIAYRRDARALGTQTLRRVVRSTRTTPSWTMRMGNYGGSIGRPPVAYPTNTTAGWTRTINGRQISFPDLPPAGGSGVAPFSLRLPFDQPFSYQGPNLGVMHEAYESRNIVFPYYVDALGNPGTLGDVDLIAPTSVGCPAGQNRVTGIARNPGSSLEIYLFGGPTSSVGSLYLGTNTTRWAGAPLPLSLSFLGMPGCSVYTDLLAPIPVRTNSAGRAVAAARIPADPRLAGAVTFGQFVLRDSRVNPAVGLATSDGVRIELGRGVGTTVASTVVSGVANLARQRTGFVQPGTGLVFRVEY